MARKVRWTEAAWSDIEKVSDYIAKDSRCYAAAFVREINNAAYSLDYMAERGRIVPEFGNPTVRELLAGNYRLIYQITEQNVYIIGFIHGARDLLAVWEQDEQSRY
ncbi:MAG: type II toxin-antitoxin system RelE/ParE family toxin [Candidatus Desantisbacteria bacterium]